MQKSPINPYIPIAIGIISVSLSAIFVKWSSAESSIIAFYRMFFTVVLMSPIFFYKYVKELKDVTRKEWIFSSIAGIFLAFHFILWFESLKYTSVASSTVLVTLQPIFAFVGTYVFFKEKVSLKGIIGALVAIVGSFLIAWGDFKVSGDAFYGDMLALIACALVTGYFLFGQEVRKGMSLTTYTMIVYVVSTIVLFIYCMIDGASFGPYDNNEWLIFLLLAIIPNLLGHNMFNWAIKYVSANVISVSILFEPIGAAILAYFLLSENLSASQLIGGSIVIAGIMLYIVDFKFIKKFF